MSSKIKILLLSCIIAPLLSSCQVENVDTEIVTFEDFGCCKYTPDTIPIGTIQIEFLDDAAPSSGESYETTFGIAVFNIDKNGQKTLIDSDIAQIYYNGEASKDNKYIATNKNGNFSIGISAVMNPDAENGIYNFSVEVMEEGQNLDKLIISDEDINIDHQNGYVNHSIGEHSIKKGDKVNPLKKGLIIGGLTFFIILFVWIFVLRYIFFPRIKVNQLQFQGPGAFFGVFIVKGCYKVILTSNKKNKQGLLGRILVGKILYIYNDVWTRDVVFGRYDSSSVSAKVSDTWYCDSYQLQKFNEYKIYDTAKKEDKGKITPM